MQINKKHSSFQGLKAVLLNLCTIIRKEEVNNDAPVIYVPYSEVTLLWKSCCSHYRQKDLYGTKGIIFTISKATDCEGNTSHKYRITRKEVKEGNC